MCYLKPKIRGSFEGRHHYPCIKGPKALEEIHIGLIKDYSANMGMIGGVPGFWAKTA
jgi:hypothetical protein